MNGRNSKIILQNSPGAYNVLSFGSVYLYSPGLSVSLAAENDDSKGIVYNEIESLSDNEERNTLKYDEDLLIVKRKSKKMVISAVPNH